MSGRYAGAMSSPFADNGMLAKVPGDVISLGSQTLPSPAAGQPERLTAEVDAGHHGRVRITFQLNSSRRGKWRNWFWTAVHAEGLDSSPDVGKSIQTPPAN
ncbi:hypothetical protein ACQ858_08580 [Variovorax ureilyticus]|uniref:hypothetical protein n=1 Tax=Variovorax ureilyticus TaxID=1836198 RepID=UPI003D67A474